MQPLSVANKLLPGILFILLAAFAPPLPGQAVTIEDIYSDDDGEGFKDGTDLTQAEKDFLATLGNDARPWGKRGKTPSSMRLPFSKAGLPTPTRSG